MEPTTRATLVERATGAEATDDLFVRKALIPVTVDTVGERTVRFVISTDAVDRDNDTIDPKGWDLKAYLKNPVVLWAHDYKSLPVGRATTVVMRDGQLISECEFAKHEFAETVFQMVKGGFLKATSVGFRPQKYAVNEQRQGLDFSQQELMEYSIVPVPSNPEALIDMRAAKAAGVNVEPLRAWAKAIMRGAEATATTDEPIRWNRTLSKAFDVEDEPAEPALLEYKWASRFLDTPVKDLYETTIHICSARMGTMLSALDEKLAAFKTLAVRNLGHDGKEYPPEHQTIQLNSTMSRSFLVDGTRFLSGEFKMVAKITPSWRGVALTFFASRDAAEHVITLISETVIRSRQYKFLKGEAMTLGGEFLQRGTASWDDLFLDASVKTPILRTAQLLNQQGDSMESRGLILMGPPGTGKTLAARALMSEAKDATFVWVSARDFHYAGTFGGIELAYDLAAENAPTVVLFEDIDSYISSEAVDLLKTELDGLKKQKGIVTVVTTNFPQRLPEALIDRPGRFHDVLNLSLPDATVRRSMLAAWAPGADGAQLDSLATATDGLSGAHLRELVRFAETLRTQDDTALGDALTTALAKVMDQRALIDAVQTGERRVYSTLRSARKSGVAAPLLRRKGGMGVCDRCGKEGEMAVAVCSACHDEMRAWSHDAAVARTAQLLDTVKADMQDTCKPTDGKCGDGYTMGEDGMCHLVQKKDDDKAADPPVICRVCEQALGLKTPRLRDDLGVVCAPCFTHASAAPEPQAVAPAIVETTTTVKESFVLDLDDGPREEVAVELDEDDDGSVIDLSPDDLRAALRSAVTSAVSTIVRDETRAAFNRARGRVD